MNDIKLSALHLFQICMIWFEFETNNRNVVLKNKSQRFNRITMKNITSIFTAFDTFHSLSYMAHRALSENIYGFWQITTHHRFLHSRSIPKHGVLYAVWPPSFWCMIIISSYCKLYPYRMLSVVYVSDIKWNMIIISKVLLRRCWRCIYYIYPWVVCLESTVLNDKSLQSSSPIGEGNSTIYARQHRGSAACTFISLLHILPAPANIFNSFVICFI